tara:strand:- start:485 stop:1162 length:678 start_codon:yes stop_codon:yes gene_type:complete
MDGDAPMVRAVVVPLRTYTDEQIEEALAELEKVGLIERYKVEDDTYLEIVGFADTQKFRSDRDRIGQFPDRRGKLPRASSTGEPVVNQETTTGIPEGENRRTSKVKTSKVKSNKTAKAKKAFESKTDGKMINDLIALFEPINPAFEKLFKQTTQRRALDEMVVKHGFEIMKNTIQSLSVTNGKKYAPTITTPMQLQNNLGKLIAFWQKEKDAGRSKGKKIAGLNN